MKPWLFDILACPIDKYFPLELYIFSYESKNEVFQALIEEYEKRDINYIKNENIIELSKKNNILYLKDNIVIEFSTLKSYINSISVSINEMDFIFDRSKNDLAKNCLNIIKSVVKPKILEFSTHLNINELQNIYPELFFLNKIKLEIEIDSGLLFCKNCNRWYPIIDTIPQMLPDEYRDEGKDTEFLRNNKNLLDENFLKQELKPFNI
ncbi:MAG: Trm112 family protein [Promethearchaeota archaeon]